MTQKILKSIAAGIFISLGCIANVSIGSYIGPILFAFGLMSVCCLDLYLFTGKAGFMSTQSEYGGLAVGFLFNVIACIFIGSVKTLDCSSIVTYRIENSIIDTFICSVFTGIIMTTAVKIYRDKRSLTGVFFGVPLFIMCKFPHCIADVYYYTCQGWTFDILSIWVLTVVGNFIGCIIPTKIFKIQ